MPKQDDQAIILSMRLHIKENALIHFLKWQATFNSTIASRTGFISLEYLCVADTDNEWLIVQRFENMESLLEWRHSNEYKILLNELKSFQKNTENEIEELESHSGDMQSGITQFFIVEVQPGKELLNIYNGG
jgi:antibiotic biosynthesis monooxygenase (ABM) superfamily enzyme